MSMIDNITVLILTYNEEENIERTLSNLVEFPSVIVLDSISNDRTAEIVARFENAELHERPFDAHAKQWNHGLSLCPESRPWVLALDADYQVTPEALDEIKALAPPPDVMGYWVSFRMLVAGRRLSGALYPPVVALFRRGHAAYEQHGHTQRLKPEGRVEKLQAPFDHDDRKSLPRWLSSQLKYGKLEADKLLSTPPNQLRRNDRIRRMAWPAPFLVFFYTLIFKRCILDGWPGWFYVLQRTFVEFLFAIEIIDRRLNSPSGKS